LLDAAFVGSVGLLYHASRFIQLSLLLVCKMKSEQS
jgi:hypothetical protein